MGTNLLDLVKGQLSEALLSKAAGFLGEDNAATTKAMNLILPSILGGMANKATNADDAKQLFGLMQNDDSTTDIFGSLSTLLGGGSATQGLLDSGGGMINALFGNKTSNIASVIASAVGMKTGSASSLMSIAAPILMNVMSRQLGAGSTASSLVSLLGSQLPFLRNTGLPATLTNALGLNNLNLTPPSVSAPKAVVEEGGMGKFLPWLLLLGAALAGFYFFKSCNLKPNEAPTAVAIEQNIAPIAPAIVEQIKKLSLPSGDIEVKLGSFLDKLYEEINDPNADLTKALTFDNVNFAVNSAQLTEGSKTQLDDLAKIMQAYPNVAIKVDGHTDNVGNAASNLRLSQARAASVKTYLSTHSIDGKRIATAGFGSTKPVADNATAEGKAQNRRIEAFVTKK
jgi:outer membrane protein OmpA-like peptidoglycan-associated protein